MITRNWGEGQSWFRIVESGGEAVGAAAGRGERFLSMEGDRSVQGTPGHPPALQFAGVILSCKF